MFHWPEHIQTVFEVCRNRLMTRREQAEEEVRKKVQRFEEKLNEFNKEVESYRKKEVWCEFLWFKLLLKLAFWADSCLFSLKLNFFLR